MVRYFTVLALMASLVTFGDRGDARPEAGGEPRGGRPDLVISAERLRDSMNVRSVRASAGDCTVFENCLPGPGKHRILEFDTYVVNDSETDLVLGNPADRPDIYEFSPCHRHYHLKNSFEYSITHGGSDTIGLFDTASARAQLRNANSSGPADLSVDLGVANAGATAVAGDWDGDGDSTIGLYAAATGEFRLWDAYRVNTEPIVFSWRPASDPAPQPVSGDWDGNRTDTVGLFDSATMTFHLKRKNGKNRKAWTVAFDPGVGDWLAIAGDWDGDDVDSVGLYDRASGRFFLRNENTSGPADIIVEFGGAGLVPLAGDWDQDGTDTIGAYDPVRGEFRLRTANAPGDPDIVCAVDSTATAGMRPLAGDWDYNTGDELVAGRKEAFCWLDTQRISGDRAMQFFDCNARQGLTAGWADIYIRGTDCQWIEINTLPPGVYQVSITVNASQFIAEQDFTNNTATVKVHIPAPRDAARAPEVRVSSPTDGQEFEIGDPVRIRWSVGGGRNVTRQELWLVDVHDGHPSKVLLIDGNVDPKARSYTWIPTEDFASPSARILVRAQDDDHMLGTDSRSQGTIRIGDHQHEGRRPCR